MVVICRYMASEGVFHTLGELTTLSATFKLRRANQSAIAGLAVTPGDSIPNSLINPATP